MSARTTKVLSTCLLQGIQTLRKHPLAFSLAILLICLMFSVLLHGQATKEVTCLSPTAVDQDDMCFWVHPTDESLSLVVCADKSAGRLITYNLDGTVHEDLLLPHMPGNIDIRYGFPRWNGSQTVKVDLIGYNTRAVTNPDICFHYVDPATRNLVSCGSFATTGWGAELYGFCMYHSPDSGEFYAMGCSKSSVIRQYEIYDDIGIIAGIQMREIQNGSVGNTEGMVCDDEMKYWYAANENEGIYVYDAEPGGGTTHLHFLPIAAGELQADVEGMTIYYAANNEGYLIASSQGAGLFTLFERNGWAFAGNFSITGVGETDGIDVLNMNLNATFPKGLFASHDGTGSPYAVVLTEWEDIADEFAPGLLIDTDYWDPRGTRELEAETD
jgi:3-phytase